MSRVRFTQENLDFLTEKYQVMYREELTEAYNQRFQTNLTVQQIISVLKNKKIKSSMPRRSLPKRKFTKEHLKFLEENYPKMSRGELTEKFNQTFPMQVTIKQITSAVKNHKIRSGRGGHFTKGHTPWNLVMKGTGAVKPNSGSFKKGGTPLNTKPLGHERVDVQGYIWIKVAEPNPYTKAQTRYKQKHYWLWEQANGPIPPESAIIFRDGNPLNCVLENLLLVTKQELLRLNKLHFKTAPEELKPVIMAVAKLEVKTFELSKRKTK